MSCALCGSVVRVGDGGLLAVHPGKELAADGLRVVICKASRFTPDGARTLAVREAADLDALRMRAHP
ncbi:hypothetical protein ACH4F6_37605 [Streptomyces sp. NPDC017936]|uniref:hypothetical protein n=1 Tax=Streptomyces sp. NPDC017936 TaxID=3365016 RepID=UPI0037B191AC